MAHQDFYRKAAAVLGSGPIESNISCIDVVHAADVNTMVSPAPRTLARPCDNNHSGNKQHG